MKLRLTKKFTFEMAHCLTGYDGPCRNIHGHSYHLEVTVEGVPSQDANSAKVGMVMDFKELKELVNDAVLSQFDHALVLSEVVADEVGEVLRRNFENVLVFPFQPTTENLLMEFARRLQKQLPDGTTLYAIRLSETENSSAELIL